MKAIWHRAQWLIGETVWRAYFSKLLCQAYETQVITSQQLHLLHEWMNPAVLRHKLTAAPKPPP